MYYHCEDMYDYEVIRSRRRSISIEINLEGRILVRAPYNIGNREIVRFVESKSDWIDKTLKKVEAKREQLKDLPEERMVSREMIEALADEAMKVIPPKVMHYAEIAGVTYGRITIRNQKSRWGSCSSKGNLNFNCMLMKAPEEVLDYVIIHELCHRKEMNHSGAFWTEVSKLCPDYKIHRKWLKDHGDELMRGEG